jgi:hypothetical protein
MLRDMLARLGNYVMTAGLGKPKPERQYAEQGFQVTTPSSLPP